jgi:hypothetical protein
MSAEEDGRREGDREELHDVTHCRIAGGGSGGAETAGADEAASVVAKISRFFDHGMTARRQPREPRRLASAGTA